MALLPRLAAREQEASVDAHERARDAGRDLVAAVENDNLEMIKWPYAYYPSANTRLVTEVASRTGRLPLLQWIADNFECVTWDPELARLAAQYGHLDTLKWIWLHPMSSSFSEHDAIDAIGFAAMNGHLAVVE